MTKRKRTGSCPYTGCNLDCASEYKHRGRYAHISQRWKKKVEYNDMKIKKRRSDKINWDRLKQLGILCDLESDNESGDCENEIIS
jgi:hypothetical protein